MPQRRRQTTKKTEESPEAPRPLPDDFKSVASRLECDEDKEAFEEKLGKIAKSGAPKPKA
jgi:hypothetical protein